MKAIERYKAHTSGAPSFAYDLCVRKITEEQRAELDLSSWKLAYNGAEPIRAKTVHRFLESFRPRCSTVNFIAVKNEHVDEARANGLLVFHNQYAHLSFHYALG